MKKVIIIRNYITFYIRHFGALVYQLPWKKEKNKLIKECMERGINTIPIFIVSFNRLSYLKQFIEQMESYGIYNLHIIDNASTYKPLLDYYQTIPYEVIFEKENKGHNVFWIDEQFAKYRKDFYVVTDPDLRIVEKCPKDFLLYFMKMIQKYPFARKIGFSLKIDDLPADGILTNDIISWEKQFNCICVKRDNVYHARVDTTFALYEPEQFSIGKNQLVGLRVGWPYQMQHLPWYKKKEDITEEDIFYSNNKTNGWSDPVSGFVPDSE